MRVLLIKTSSMGDVLHTLPALSDAQVALENISFDWMVEDTFAEIPTWHSAVKETIPISLRRWRKTFFTRQTRDEWRRLRTLLKARQYDIILDAQGLVKSALLTFLAKGRRTGLDWSSARESFASLAYQQKCTVDFKQHAVVRMRQLFSQALGYRQVSCAANFGLNRQSFLQSEVEPPYLVFLHATTWSSKQWPEAYWIQLAKLAEMKGLGIKISGGSSEELARAKRIADAVPGVTMLPRQTIANTAKLLANAQGVVAVDTGFAHLSGALSVPTLSLFGPTNPTFTGVLGRETQNLLTAYPCSPCLRRTCKYPQAEIKPPCFTTLSPELVWEKLQGMMGR